MRAIRLVRELGKGVPLPAEPAGPAPDPAAAAALQGVSPIWQPPCVAAKRLLAARQSWDAFGPLVAAAAWALGLLAADP